MRTQKQKFFLFLKIFTVVLLLTFGAIYFFRDAILQTIISKAEFKFDRDYDCRFSVKKASFIGLSEMEFNEILLVPKQADTLSSVERRRT